MKSSKFNEYIKTIFQIIIVIVELGLIVGIATAISCRVFPIPCTDKFQLYERIGMFYGFYQIFVYIILSNINDIRADEYLALKRCVSWALLGCTKNNEAMKTKVYLYIEEQFKPENFNHSDVIKIYDSLKKFTMEDDIISIECMLIDIQHLYDTCNLKWKFSFLLRLSIFK